MARDFNNNQTKDSGAIPVRPVSNSYTPDPASFPTPPPASLAASGAWVSGVIGGSGGVLAVNAKLTQAGTLSVQRYMDIFGAIPIGPASVQALSANVDGYVIITDGYPYLSYIVTVTNTSGSTATLSDVFVLEQNR